MEWRLQHRVAYVSCLPGRREIALDMWSVNVLKLMCCALFAGVKKYSIAIDM